MPDAPRVPRHPLIDPGRMLAGVSVLGVAALVLLVLAIRWLS